MLIQRFDRAFMARRLLYVSAATFLGVEFNELRKHFYMEMADALRVYGAAAMPVLRDTSSTSPGIGVRAIRIWDHGK